MLSVTGGAIKSAGDVYCSMSNHLKNVWTKTAPFDFEKADEFEEVGAAPGFANASAMQQARRQCRGRQLLASGEGEIREKLRAKGIHCSHSTEHAPHLLLAITSRHLRLLDPSAFA